MVNEFDYKSIENKLENIAKKEGIKPGLFKNNYVICKNINDAIRETKNNKKLKLKYKNTSYYLGDFCRTYYLDLNTFKSNYLNSNTIEEAVEKTLNIKSRKFILDLGKGEKSYTINQISQVLGYPKTTIYNCYKKTKDIKKAITLAEEKNKQLKEINFIFKDEDGINEYTIKTLANKYNVTYQSLKNNYYKYKGDVKQALEKSLQAKSTHVLPHKILYDDGNGIEEYSLLSLAQKYNVTRATLRKNLSKYPTIEESIEHAINSKRNKIEIDLGFGKKTYTVNQIAKRYKSSPKTLQKLLKEGLTIEESIIELIATKPNSVYYDFGFGEEKATINKVAKYCQIDRIALQKEYNKTSDIYLAVDNSIKKSRPRKKLTFKDSKEEKQFKDLKELTDYHDIPYQSFVKYLRDNNNVYLTTDYLKNKILNFNMKYIQLKNMYEIRNSASTKEKYSLIKQYNLSYTEILQLLLIDLNYYNNGLLLNKEDPIYKRNIKLKEIVLAWDLLDKEDLIITYNLTIEELEYINNIINLAKEIYLNVIEKSKVKTK